MSLSRHFLAILLATLPLVGCDVEDDADDDRPIDPAPTEPNRPVPEPQVTPGGRTGPMLAGGSPTAAGPAFAPPAG